MDIVLRISVVLVLCIPVSAEVNLPRDMSQAIYCECCSAVMQEIDKLLAKKSSDPRELQVVEAMEDICQAKYFSKYHYSPPTTIKACKFLIEKYEEDIEQLLIEKTGDSAEQKVCYKLTKACEGVDRTKKEKEDMDVRFNDQKQEVKNKPQKDDDGIHRMNVDINDPGAAARLAEQIKMQMGQQAMGGGSHGGDDDDGDDEDDDEEEEDEEGGDGPEDGTQSSNKKTEL